MQSGDSPLSAREVPEKFYNLEVLAKYLPLMPYSEVVESYYRGIMLPYKHQTRTTAELRPYADAIYAELIRRINGPEDRYYAASRNTRYSPRQWRDAQLYHSGPQVLGHARILYETGAADQALEALEPLKEVLAGRISDYNDLYAKLLAANGYTHLVVPFIEACIKTDAATPAMLETLRSHFAGKNAGGNFDDYLMSLRSEDHIAHMEAKLLGELIREKVEPFKLESMKGGTVDMAALKGKVIVIDFWATWCTPCMAAMPGMKMALERYKDNPDVVFFFIDTMERGEGYKEYVPQVMEARGYHDFNVLYDAENDKGRHGVLFEKYGAQFGMSGIPQKMVIDREGYARWVSGGYFGNPLELANEVSFVVDYVLKEKK